MSLKLQETPLTSKNIYASDYQIAEFSPGRDVVFMSNLYLQLANTTGDLTYRVEILDKLSPTQVSWGSKNVTQAKVTGTTGNGHFIAPTDRYFLPAAARALFWIRSTSSSDIDVGLTLIVYDPNYPTPTSVETRDAETVPSLAGTAAVYAAGDAVGEQITFAAGSNKGSIIACRVLDKAKQHANLELWLFRASTTHTTDLKNNEPFKPSDTQLLNLAAVVPINDWFDSGLNSVGQAGNLPLSFADLTSGALYGWLVARGTPTYVSGDLTVEIETLVE